MAYDALAESVALIGSRQVVRVERLSRRRRSVAMSVDVDGALAVTSFARRGAGCTWHDTHVLTRQEGHWVLLGGGSGTGARSEELLADRPPVLAPWSAEAHRAATTHLVAEGTGGVHDSRGGADRWPWSGRWVRHSHLRVSGAVDSLQVGGRVVVVPWHGRVGLVWTGRRRPLVVALDRDGREVARLVLPT